MTNTKAMFLGAVAGWLSMLAGLHVAKADCDLDYTPEALAWDIAVMTAEERCGLAAEGWLESGLSEDVVGGQGGMWEACMRLATPVGPLSAAQHYDTTDGAFWTVEP
jgi:hypothetical protein